MKHHSTLDLASCATGGFINFNRANFDYGGDLKKLVYPGDPIKVGTSDELMDSLKYNEPIKLQSSISLSSPVEINEGMNTSIDLNGNNLSAVTEVNDGDSASDIYAIWTKGGKLTIEGSGIVSAADADYSMAIWAQGDSEVIIKGGTFINGGDACDLIYASDNAKVIIYGGVFKATSSSQSEPGTKNPYSALNIKDRDRATASITVYGGKFYGFNPADNLSEGPNTNFVAEGYKVVESTEDDMRIYEVVKE